VCSCSRPINPRSPPAPLSHFSSANRRLSALTAYQTTAVPPIRQEAGSDCPGKLSEVSPCKLSQAAAWPGQSTAGARHSYLSRSDRNPFQCPNVMRARLQASSCTCSPLWHPSGLQPYCGSMATSLPFPPRSFANSTFSTFPVQIFPRVVFIKCCHHVICSGLPWLLA
jgi:hypothetical protein